MYKTIIRSLTFSKLWKTEVIGNIRILIQPNLFSRNSDKRQVSNFKKALELNQNNLEQGEIGLNKQAQALGWSKAEKVEQQLKVLQL